jgi:hypothetical protein
LLANAKKTMPPKTKLSEHSIVMDKGDVQPVCHKASTWAGEGVYPPVVVDVDSQKDIVNDQPTSLFAPISGQVEDYTMTTPTNTNNELLIEKEATLECVLIGATIEETLTSYNMVLPHVVDVSSSSLDIRQQIEGCPSDEDWKQVAPKKKNKDKGDVPTKAPKGPKKGPYFPPIGSKVLRNALSKKASSSAGS